MRSARAYLASLLGSGGMIVLLIVLVTPGGLSSLPALFIRLRSRYRGEKPAVEEESSGSAMEEADLSVVSQIEAVQADPVLEASDLPLLSITGLSKSFGGLRAVQDVNLSVRTGDRHAIIGPNGAGKSTLFNLITGRLRPDRRHLYGQNSRQSSLPTEIEGRPSRGAPSLSR